MQTEFFASAFASTLPASQDCLDEYWTAQQEDSTSRQLITFCQQGWPYRPQLKGDLLSYWHVRGDLTLHDNLLLYDRRIIVPKNLQATALQEEDAQWTSRHSEVLPVHYLISMAAWSV